MSESIGQRTIFSPSEVNAQIKEILEQLSFWVKGEISEFSEDPQRRWYYSYITLKDGQSQIKCIVRPSIISALPFKIETGKEILVFGRLSVYGVRGEYQLQIQRIEEMGDGDLQKKLEELKKKLQKEGLFAQERKRPLPLFPERIGVITSASGAGAAWSDVQKMAEIRFPGIELVLADVFVEGEKAAPSIIKAIQALNERKDIDVLILTRGGGSVESLMAFNDELMARAVAASKLPIVCAVGHEKDVSIAELVADRRASTPSDAVTTTLRDRKELLQRVDQINLRIQQAIKRFTEMPQELAKLRMDIIRRYLSLVQTKQERLQELIGKIQAIGPKATLSRGYSIVYAVSTKRIVKKAEELTVGDDVVVRFSKGKVGAKVRKLI